jgi:hypothetical protein
MVVFIMDGLRTKSLDGMSFEIWHGRKPDVYFMCMFGCVVHIQDTHPGLKKLNDQSWPIFSLWATSLA